MRVIVHAGLHKSGTTTAQTAFASAFGELGNVHGTWYPPIGPPCTDNHAPLFWPFLAGVDPSDNPIDPALPTLRDRVTAARENGVRRLLLSTEELDRFSTSDAEGLVDVLGGVPDTVLFTVTEPGHRWCSGWQELVKHGERRLPLHATDRVLTFASLQPGRLEELVMSFPSRERIVRIVRTSPQEAGLPTALAGLLAVPITTIEQEHPHRNPSMGTRTELLRRLHASGLDPTEARERAGELARRWRPIPDQPADEGWGLAPEVAAAAEAEYRFLRSPRSHGRTSVVDPWGVLDEWTTLRLSPWYEELAAHAWELREPGPNRARGAGTAVPEPRVARWRRRLGIPRW